MDRAHLLRTSHQSSEKINKQTKNKKEDTEEDERTYVATYFNNWCLRIELNTASIKVEPSTSQQASFMRRNRKIYFDNFRKVKYLQ